jgi:hypothetical protein
LTGFEVLNLTIAYPLGHALQVGVEEVADAVGVFEVLDVDGEGGEDL